jgi:hypothetical protein
MLVGHIWFLKWYTPYTPEDQIPGGKRVLAAIFVPCAYVGSGARRPDILDRITYPEHFNVCVKPLETPMKQQSREQKIAHRKRNLKRRIEKKYPLFADEFIQDELERKKEYFDGYHPGDAERELMFREERETYETFTSNPNHLFVYSDLVIYL